MAALTRRQILTATGGGLAAVAVAGVVGDSVLPALLRNTVGLRDLRQRTAFGRVAVVRARRMHRSGAVGQRHGQVAHSAGPDGLDPQHLVWSDYVRVDIEVENTSPRPVLLSPGQFRLRVNDTGPTVSLYDAGHQVLALAAGTTLTTWVGFLAPPEEPGFGVEYTEAGAAMPHTFRILPEVHR